MEELSQLLVVRSGVRPKSRDKKDVISAVRQALGGSGNSTIAVADRWLTLREDAEAALTGPLSTKDESQLLTRAVQLAHFTTLAIALAQGESGLATFDAGLANPPDLSPTRASSESGGDGLFDKAAQAIALNYRQRCALLNAPPPTAESVHTSSQAVELLIATIAAKGGAKTDEFISRLPFEQKAARYLATSDLQYTVALQRLLVELTGRRAAAERPQRAAAARQIAAEAVAASAAADSAPSHSSIARRRHYLNSGCSMHPKLRTPSTALTWVLICLSPQVASAVVVLPKGSNTPVMGYLVRRDERIVVMRRPLPDGKSRELRFPPGEIDELIITVSPERLAALDPAKPEAYFEYAEELAEKQRDPEARETAVRLYAICAVRGDDRLRHSAALGLDRNLTLAGRRAALRAAAYLFDAEHDESVLAPPTSGTAANSSTSWSEAHRDGMNRFPLSAWKSSPNSIQRNACFAAANGSGHNRGADILVFHERQAARMPAPLLLLVFLFVLVVQRLVAVVQIDLAASESRRR